MKFPAKENRSENKPVPEINEREADREEKNR